MDTIKEKLEEFGYALLPSLIPEKTRDFLQAYALAFAAREHAGHDDQVPGTPAFYGDHAMELLLRSLVPKLEGLTGRRLHPTYAYFRVYRHADVLERHRDRPACEISLTLSIGCEGTPYWPLFIEGKKGIYKAELRPGDALIYRGIECDHWREPFAGTSAPQAFLHYVDQDGPYKEWRFDKRSDLNRFKGAD